MNYNDDYRFPFIPLAMSYFITDLVHTVRPINYF